MKNKSSNHQSQCQLCKMSPINPISLICSHSLCLKCGQNIQIQETSSQIQNKFRIQCPKCRKVTHTYDIKNLLIENNELNLITDSSEMDKEILNESSLCHLKAQQEAILGRRKSNIYQMPEPQQKSAQQKMNDLLHGQVTPQNHQTTNSSNTLYTDCAQQFNKKKPTIGSEKISPTRQIGQGHQKKQSYPIQLGLDLLTEATKIKSNLNVSQNQKNNFEPYKQNVNTPNATPYSTPLASQFPMNYDYTDYKKQQQQQQPQQQQQVGIIQQLPTQNLRCDKLLFYDEKKHSTPKCTDNHQKENQFQKESSKEVTEPSRHKRSSTGLPNNETEPTEQGSQQIIQQYFKMVQKNLAKIEKDLIICVQTKNVDPQSLYGKLKSLSTRIGDQEGDLVQSVRVLNKLQQELNGMATPSYHRKTSSHQNTSHRYTNSSNNNKTHEKSDNSTTSIPQQQELKIYKKFL